MQGPRKLKPRWLGPFTVLERVSPVNYRLLLPPELGTMHNVFHATVLKPWKDDGRQPVARPGPVLVDGEQEYLVEAILAHRLIDAKQPSKGCWYLVKWAGYPISDATWEPRGQPGTGCPGPPEGIPEGENVVFVLPGGGASQAPQDPVYHPVSCLEGRGEASSVQATEGVAEGTLQGEGDGVQQCWLQGSIFARIKCSIALKVHISWEICLLFSPMDLEWGFSGNLGLPGGWDYSWPSNHLFCGYKCLSMLSLCDFFL